jgi:hypothetical protein
MTIVSAELLPEVGDEQDLLAFRYVAGEMAAEEARAFEGRLADDQEAREAVSRAVGFSQRLAEAGPLATDKVTPSLRETGRVTRSLIAASRPLGWMAAGAAAALLVVNLMGWPRGPTIDSPGTTGPEGGPRPQPAADALVWASLQGRQDLASAELEHLFDESAATTSEVDGEFGGSPELPTWIFAVTREPEKRGKQ